MRINDLTLPSKFVTQLLAGELKVSWSLKSKIDGYGNFLETELAWIYQTEEKLAAETSQLPIDFKQDGFYGNPDESDTRLPGFIPDILDFSEIIEFGSSFDDAPFCFDFRDNPSEPSVIWWDDVYWRRIAPDFTSFMALFHLDTS